MLNVPIDTQYQTHYETVRDTVCCETAKTCPPCESTKHHAPEEAVTVKRVVRKLQPGEQLQGATSLPTAAQQAPLEPIISPSSSVQSSVQRFVRPLSQSASVTQQP